MPNDFQKVGDSLLLEISFKNCYIDKILIAPKGSFEERKSFGTKTTLEKTTGRRNGAN